MQNKKPATTSKIAKRDSLKASLQHLALIFAVSQIVAANNKKD